MSELNHDDLPGVIVPGYDDAVEHGAGAIYLCHDEGGEVCAVGVVVPGDSRPRELPLVGDVKWGWNGNAEYPTLQPSIKALASDGSGGMLEIWHGFLIAGEFKSC